MYVYVQGIDIRLYDWRIITVQAIDFLVRENSMLRIFVMKQRGV